MNGISIFAARLAAAMLVASGAFAQTRTPPVVVHVAENPGWLDFYWEHDRRDVDGYHVWRQDLPRPLPYLPNAILHHEDKNLPSNTTYRYRVCAIYDGEDLCAEPFDLRTSLPPEQAPAQSRPPPELTSSVVFDEPGRIQIRWRKTGNYDRVIVRWWLESNPVPSQVDHDGPSDGFHEMSAPMPGVYVIQLKGCMVNFIGDTRCGEWSKQYRVNTMTATVAHVNCQPGILKGAPQFSADGRAAYQFHNPPPERTDYVGRCLDPRGQVAAFYLTDGTWNPHVRAGAQDRSGANATENFTLTLFHELSPDRTPRRPDGQKSTINFLLRAQCDRDPWLHADAVCRRTGDNVPADIRAKWPGLLSEPFPHTRNSVAAGDRAALIARYRLVTDRVTGRAEPTVDPNYLEPVDRDAIQGQARNTPAATAASRPAQTTRGAAQAQASESQLVPARPTAGGAATVLQRQTPTVLAGPSTTSRSASQTLTPATPTSSRAVQAASQGTLVLVCRGGSLMGWTPYVEDGSGRRMTSLIFQPQSQSSLIDSAGAGLKPSECGFPTQLGYAPPRVVFEAGNVDVRALLANESNYHAFDVVPKHGFFEATAHRALQTANASVTPQGSRPVGPLEVTRRAVSNTDGYSTLEEDGRPLATPGTRIQGVAANAGRAASLERDCVRNGPRISHLRGRITPDRSFTINGSCFGGQAGEVRLIGAFAGGTLRPPFTQWTDSAIVVQMPALADVASHVIAVSVHRRPDGKTSAATRAQFVAAMREVEIPATAWSPSGQFSFEDEDRRLGGPIGDHAEYSRIAERKSTRFRLAVNAACELQTLAVPATVGGIHAINGWDAGPPNEANVEVVWTPVCKLETTAGLPGVTRERRTCSGAYRLQARASCPVGVAPL